MIKRGLLYIAVIAISVVLFNLLDFLFDRLVSHSPFTFDSLSNLILPVIIGIAVCVMLYFYKKLFKSQQ